MKLRIQAWHQPNGRGYGWAVQHGNAKHPTTCWAIYRPDTGEIVAWRPSKIAALELAKQRMREKA